jgi:hypothetical protein
MGFRAALHQAGAAALTQLLQFPSLPQTSASSRARAASKHATANCAREGFSPHWARWNCRVPGIYVCPVTTVSSLSIVNWISRTATALRVCAACRLWWASRCPSIMDASR